MRPVIDKNGTKRWYDENEELHRDGDNPAVEQSNGGLPREWYKHGVRHRTDGPAVIRLEDGVFEVKEYWLYGIEYPINAEKLVESEFKKIVLQKEKDREAFNESSSYLCDIPSDDATWDIFSDGSTEDCSILGWVYFSEEDDKKLCEKLEEIEFFQQENAITIQYNNGNVRWLCNGKSHKIDGPAIENADGSKEWWVDGEMISEEEYNKKFPKE